MEENTIDPERESLLKALVSKFGVTEPEWGERQARAVYNASVDIATGMVMSALLRSEMLCRLP